MIYSYFLLNLKIPNLIEIKLDVLIKVKYANSFFVIINHFVIINVNSYLQIIFKTQKDKEEKQQIKMKIIDIDILESHT